MFINITGRLCNMCPSQTLKTTTMEWATPVQTHLSIYSTIFKITLRMNESMNE